MNPEELKQILDALTTADVREFSLRTGGFDLSLKRGPHFGAVATGPAPLASPMSYSPPPIPASAGAPAHHTPHPPKADVSQANALQANALQADTPKPTETPKAAAGTPVKAPIVGTFYAASSPDAPAFVKVGDTVKAGQVLCIIEAMKLMNEIEAETGGVVREILVKNAEPVEYGQTLFMIE